MRTVMARGILVATLVVAMASGETRGERGTPTDVTAGCAGYVEHLRSARELLGKGNRAAAAVELRAAQKALDACSRSDAPPEGVASTRQTIAPT